jgi:hypothetical protein
MQFSQVDTNPYIVNVLSVDGKPLSNTCCSKARRLVKNGKAFVKLVSPFTIQLRYQTKTEFVTKPKERKVA